MKSRSAATTAKYLSLLVGAVCSLTPIVVIFFASLKSDQEYARTGPLTPPHNWLNFHNFVAAFVRGHMGLGFANTAIVLVGSLTGTILIGTMAAYALDRFDFRGRKLVLALFLVATLVPAVTTQVATYQVVNALGLTNTYWAAIVLFSGTDIVAIYIFLQFMQSIPKSLDEAAMLDGANHLTIYWRIILPVLRPAIVTVIIVKGIAIYNEFYLYLLYMPSSDLQVVSTSLFRFKGPFGSEWEVIAAGIMIAILPTLVAFLVLQRHIYNGFAAGATK